MIVACIALAVSLASAATTVTTWLLVRRGQKIDSGKLAADVQREQLRQARR